MHTHSRFVADEVVEAFGADPGRVRAVAPGVPVHGRPAEPDGAAGRVGSLPAALPAGATRYVLAVGTVEPRKDYPGLVHAFDRIASAHPDTALVIAGVDGWGADAFHRARAAARCRDRIVQLGYVSDDDLGRWLSGAEVLAFPSVYEGFGFPPLEAMAHGVPVVAAAAGSVPEVVGNAAVLVAPRDADALRARAGHSAGRRRRPRRAGGAGTAAGTALLVGGLRHRPRRVVRRRRRRAVGRRERRE